VLFFSMPRDFCCYSFEDSDVYFYEEEIVW
jgi:hypothetical protein